MKLLHSADWHLDAPLNGHDDDLRDALLEVPGKIAALVRQQGCDLVLLSGDLFDAAPSRESFAAACRAFEEMAVPVFIAPGNHDPAAADSVWITEKLPANVHVFTEPRLESVVLEELDCRIYGAGFDSMDCPPLLALFQAERDQRHAICLLHGDPLTAGSPYCPISTDQVRGSALDYLALGHIHKTGSFRAGSTLCAWPGCPMGRGFDELGPKGVLLVTLEDTAEAVFLPLDTPRFHDLQLTVGVDPAAALEAALPPVANNDHYRITLTGECPRVDLPALEAAFSRFPHLQLRDRTVPPVDLWATAGEDTLEGIYFGLLRQALETADEAEKGRVGLAAKLSRRILDGAEVTLP